MGTVTCEFESIMSSGKLEKLKGEDSVHALKLLLDHCGYKNFEFNISVVEMINVHKITLEDVAAKRRKI